MALDLEEKYIETCVSQVRNLDTFLKKFIVGESNERSSHWRRGLAKVDRSWRAFRSIRADGKIEDLQMGVDRMLNLISLQLQTRTA